MMRTYQMGTNQHMFLAVETQKKEILKQKNTTTVNI